MGDTFFPEAGIFSAEPRFASAVTLQKKDEFPDNFSGAAAFYR
jgi:hypothetical protein